MAKQHVSAAAIGLPAHPAVFLAITPEIRRALEMLAEASISLLDEIDRPVAEFEADEDFEVTREDEEDGGDDEAELGWTEDGQVGGHQGWEGGGEDEDFVGPETSGGFPRNGELLYEYRAEQKSLFDPRLAARPKSERGWGSHPIPPFPHDPPGRTAFYVDEELRRLRREMKAGQAVRRSRRRAK